MLDSLLFWNTFTIISTIVEWIVFRFIIQEFSELKTNRIKENITLILIIFITVILTIYDVNQNIKLFIDILNGYIFSMYNYKVNELKRAIINLIYWMILLSLDSVGVSIILFINSLDSIFDLLHDNIFRLEFTILSKILLVSIVPMVKGAQLKIELKTKDFINIIIPILANILSIVVIFSLIIDSVKINDYKNLIILTVSGILLLSNLSLINIIRTIIKSNNLDLENTMIKEKIDLQYNYYLTLEESQMKVRKLYHDIQNHINCIHHIYDYNENAEKYIKSIKDELISFNSIFSTDNIILDSILNDKKKICDKNNIEFFANINLSKCKFIEMIDVCSIFSNILDNAIEACCKIQREEVSKFIRIKGTIVNEFFVIKCENSKINEVNMNSNGTINTNKENKFLHGIGISSIKNSVNKYNGEVNFNYSNYKFIITIYIPLN